MLGTNDLGRARGFYDPLMALFGASVHESWSTAEWVWYMTAVDAPMLAVTKPYGGRPATAGNGSMLALRAPSRNAVRAAHAKAIELGGADEGEPGHRSSDPGDLYRAYVRDPGGNKLMVFTIDPA
jgi:hypothetical protein